MPEQGQNRVVKAVHGQRSVDPDAAYEVELAQHLRDTHSREALVDLYARFKTGMGAFDTMMRRVLWRAIGKQIGQGLRVEPDVGFKHLETFEIGDGVFIGSGAYIQGRYDGRCIIGDHTWIGPGSYFDARDLILGSYVGWGPGAKVLGSQHTGIPEDVPIIQTDLEIKPVEVGDWADIGVNAVILPGIKVGKGCIIGAGAVVTHDVEPFAIVAGVPARFLRWRSDKE